MRILTIRCAVWLVLPLLVLPLLVLPLSGAEPLDSVLAKMDRAAASFKSMNAKIKRTAHTEVINEDHTDSGAMTMKRSRSQDTRMLIDLTAPDAKTIALQGHTVDIYLPKIKTVQEYDVGKNRELLDQFLLLGFGSSGKDLSRAYDVTWMGAETANGQKTAHLRLVPKSPEVLKQLKTIDLWLSDANSYPVRQKFNQPSGDYTLVVFSDLKINPDLPDSALKLKLPKGVKREYPQK